PIRHILYPLTHIHSTALLRRNSDAPAPLPVFRPHAGGLYVLSDAPPGVNRILQSDRRWIDGSAPACVRGCTLPPAELFFRI
ncbi:MAG: hypothetical protein KAJ19_21920, partial [Gammaproteobacteria bacterium]|nr:hypothetical protein [Gammaproteobacteria bacterium]